MSEQEWDFVLDVNLKGTFLANQAAFRYLRDNGGRIVNVTSPVAFVATADRCHYAASKGGVASLSRALAAEWGRYDITVVALSVVAHTAMTDRLLATLSDKERAAYERRLKSGPLGRVGDPEADIALALMFLVSDAARYITAQIVAVDGGAMPLRWRFTGHRRRPMNTGSPVPTTVGRHPQQTELTILSLCKILSRIL